MRKKYDEETVAGIETVFTIRKKYWYLDLIGTIAGGVLSSILTTGISESIVNIDTSGLEKFREYYPYLGVPLIIIIGFGLNHLKKINQTLYGLLEILLSIIASTYAINRYLSEREAHPEMNWDDMLNIAVPFVTAIYFTQRGFNNYFDGNEKLKSKKLEKDHKEKEAALANQDLD